MSLMSLLQSSGVTDAYNDAVAVATTIGPTISTLKDKKAYLNTVRQIVAFLVDSPDAVYCGWKGTGKMTDSDAGREIVAKIAAEIRVNASMNIRSDYRRHRLMNWRCVAGALLALHKMTVQGDALTIASEVVRACVDENDDLQHRMHQRALRDHNASGHGDLAAPGLQNAPRKDIADEAKWTRFKEWLIDRQHGHEARQILKCLEAALESDEKPTDVYEMLKNLVPPPGHVTAAERKDLEKLRRAQDLATDADWLLENVPSNARNEGVETDTESDEPTPPPPRKRPRKAPRLDEWGFEAVHEGTPPGKPCL